MKNKNTQISYITVLQAFAIICVIVGHATRIFYYPNGWYYHKPPFYSDILNAFTRIIYTFHMPLFIFISGYLCENTLFKKTSIIDFVKRRINRLVIPFWTWGLLYSVPIWIFLQFPNCNYKTFITGQVMGHLWFLPVLLEITFIYLLIRKIPPNYNYIIFIILILIQFFHFKTRGHFAIFRIPEFLVYYYMGAKFFELEKKEIFSNKLFLNISSIITLLAFILVEVLLFYNNFKCKLLFILAGLFGVVSLFLLSKIIVKKFINLSNNKIIKYLSINLFSIYLIHEPILEIILKYIDWGTRFEPIITISILFWGTLILTIIMIIIINYIYLFIKNIQKRNLC